MTLVRAEAKFKLYPAKHVYQQKVKLRPNEHYYEGEGEELYIKYTCQLCEQIAEKVKGFPLYTDDEGGQFIKFSFPKGTKQCPCCNINIEWDY